MPLNSANNIDLAGNPELIGDILLILGDLQDAILFFDREWRVIYANQNARRINRLDLDRIQQSSHWDLFPDALGQELARKYRRAMEDRVEERHDFYYEAFGLWIESRIVPIASGVALIYRDVTPEKHEEKERQAVTRQLAQVLEATTDAIFYLDHDYNFTYMNRRATELLAPEVKLIGANFWDRFPNARYEGSPFEACYRRSMEQRVPCELESYYPEPLNKWFCVESRPAADGIIVFFHDITQSRADKESLRVQLEETARRHAELEAIYRTTPVGLALFDPVHFRYTSLNDKQAEFFGLTRDQLRGKPVTFMAPIEGIVELFQQVAAGHAIHGRLLEGELTSRPGDYRYWIVSYDPVFGADGTTVEAISAVSTEITQQKLAEAALIQSEKLAAVGRLSQSIAHEINNPLDSITNLLYLIATDTDLSAQTREYLDTAQGEVGRVAQIATQTLSQHRQSANPCSVSAKGLMHAVIDLYKSRLLNSNIVVEEQLNSQLPILCQENEIRQVLNNLIANAIDAMPHGGRLLMRSRDVVHPVTGRPGVSLTVADTGEGMSTATQKRIFEPFYTTKEMRGTGLGMWISSDIISRHEGKLRFRSSEHTARHGTVFCLFLPSERRIAAREPFPRKASAADALPAVQPLEEPVLPAAS